MISANVARLLEQANALSPEEREQLRLLMGQQPVASNELSKEDQVQRLLLERGVISRIPPKPTPEDIARFNAWKPIQIEGKPISQTIIEERR